MRKGAKAAMTNGRSKFRHTPAAKLVILIGIVGGYILGWAVKERLKLTGPLYGGLFGMGGAILGMLAVQPIVFRLSKKK